MFSFQLHIHVYSTTKCQMRSRHVNLLTFLVIVRLIDLFKVTGKNRQKYLNNGVFSTSYTQL